MGLLKFFSGKDPEEYEKQGDAYFNIGEFGAAKLEYENAFNKLEKKRPDDIGDANRLQVKIVRSRESLARAHMEGGKERMAQEVPEERARYFRKISRIYAAQGHEDESLRYLAFAERLEDEEGSG